MRLFPVALMLLLAWGALAFGGSPTWAAAATLVLAVTAGVLGFLDKPFAAPSQRALTVALILVLASIALQLLPLPPATRHRFSPAAAETNFEQQLANADRQTDKVSQASDQPRPLSIVPARTELGLAGVAGLALLLLGASRGFSSSGTRGVVRAIAIIGVVVTFVGLYQKASTGRLVYGWYVPLFTDARSAPFLNPNHQAGWLLMVMSLTLGAFAGEIARGMRGVAPRWRDRLLWLSSKDASIATLLLFMSAALAVGILAAGARSGAVGLILIILALAFANSLRQPTRARRVGTGAGLILLGIMVLAFNGEAVLRELAATQGPGTRQAIWNDTLRIAEDFWLTGTGFNTYGAAMLKYQTVGDGFRYIEAHSDYLQLAAEGGLLVGIPFLILAIVLIVEIRRRFRERADDTRTYWIRVGAVTGIVAIALQSTIEFTLQMPGGAVMFTTLLAIAIHRPPPRVHVRERDTR